jgi:Protein of unknown function (DUF2946)
MRFVRHRWVRLVALFAVLVHAYATLTHHGMMISMAAADTSGGLGVGVMCRADGSKDIVDFDDLMKGGTGKPTKAMTCPICSGAVPSAAMSAPALTAGAAPPIASTVSFAIETAALPVARAPKPPSTGPPTHV